MCLQCMNTFRAKKYHDMWIYINEYLSLRELKQALERYVTEYNKERPHETLGYKAISTSI